MEYNCNDCINKIKSEKFFYCKECSTCTNGEKEDYNNNFQSIDKHKQSMKNLVK